MTRKDTEAIVREVYAAFNTCDAGTVITTVRRHFADDVVVREAGSLPWGGDFEGIETVSAMTAGLADPASPIDAANLRIDELIAAPGSASGVSHVVAAVSFPWRGTERTIAMRALEWFTFRDDKVAEIQIYLWDSAAGLAALGLPGPAAPIGAGDL
ncbi:nuclear transport factor 2 family protein [Streptomyces sp. NPDC098781]|uniref:nuclear transport factor 2 family protein n=1 Tax=Streptomyces sp. NPDC098781 TaxID=3366097 RepID=UPI003810BB4A